MVLDGKQRAGEKAVEYVQEGMYVGLGTGSTVYWSILKLGELVKNGLHVGCIATSKQTEALATKLGIPLVDISVCTQLDVTIDGADEVDECFNLIKGGGGALFREKMVASISRRLVVVVDASKCVKTLGKFALPVEVVQFGWNVTSQRVAELGCRPRLRMENEAPYITDNGNYIVDCAFDAITDPAALNRQLHQITGVVETGLFVGMADALVIGKQDTVIVKENNDEVQEYNDEIH